MAIILSFLSYKTERSLNFHVLIFVLVYLCCRPGPIVLIPMGCATHGDLSLSLLRQSRWYYAGHVDQMRYSRGYRDDEQVPEACSTKGGTEAGSVCVWRDSKMRLGYNPVRRNQVASGVWLCSRPTDVASDSYDALLELVSRLVSRTPETAQRGECVRWEKEEEQEQ